MTIGTRLYTMLNGELVGSDSQGNRYYRSRRASGRERRWVLYSGAAEASRIPPEWHAWLHRTTDETPGAETRWNWQREHASNPTGTDRAYRPPGHMLKGGKRAPARGDYEPWRPV